MKILVTGANGFVGKTLVADLLDEGHEVYALVRSKDHLKVKSNKLHWLVGDLLRPLELPDLPLIDKAFYLVHGLKEDDISFVYYESLVAVNFINWIRPHSPGIIYLGGLGESKIELSPHLRSRQLTGAILGASGMSTIEFRASIILGEGSLSFEMIKAIAERIPFRPDFSLLDRLCQPLALIDLLKYFQESLHLDVEGHKIFEIGGPEKVSYGELLDLYIELSNLKRIKFKIPEIDIKVLLKFLDYAIPELAESGKKLIKSLEYPTLVTNDYAQSVFPQVKPRSLRMGMDMTMASSKTHYKHLWEKDFLKSLLSDKILTQSGLFSPELMKNLEKFAKLKDIFARKS